MRRAEDVLAVIRDRGTRRLPLGDLYRQLFNPTLYLRAYGRIYSNVGAMTPGTTEETADGMSLAKIEQIIAAIRSERYRWTPVRREYIPKKNGAKRPLGLPTWSDKLLQEVMRSLLEAYFEPQFSDASHGFRPGRGCHTALTEIAKHWTGTKWFIEGDIKGCFDHIDHATLLAILRQSIPDNRFVRLVENLLKAGYLEQWQYHATQSGTPQGGILSPLLSNIYLHRLDSHVTDTLLPEYHRGISRRPYPEYANKQSLAAYHWRKGHKEKAQALNREYRRLPSVDPQDPNYRRLRYVRYADDFLLGFIGSRAEAEEIRAQLAAFLREHLKLELSADKTLITHALRSSARFLGYDITVSTNNDYRTPDGRRTNRAIDLRVPGDVIERKRNDYRARGKAQARPQLRHDDDFSIVARYQSEYRGFVQYYLLAVNIRWLDKLRWTMQTSLLKTLAKKHGSSVRKMFRKYRSTVHTDCGKRRCLKVEVAREGKNPLCAYFGGIPLRQQRAAKITDLTLDRKPFYRSELLKRMLAEKCEVCGKMEPVEVHHVRRLADLRVKGRKEKPLWQQKMAARRRKTLVLCPQCHDDLHAGRPLRYAVKE